MLDSTSDVDGFLKNVDIGDRVAVTGEVIASKRGQLSVEAASWRITAKCLRPLPDKHKGLADPRGPRPAPLPRPDHQPRTPGTCSGRAAATIHSLRDSLHARAFIELETPILQRVHAAPMPGRSRRTSTPYDMEPVFLRIAPELYLKRLAVGGGGAAVRAGPDVFATRACRSSTIRVHDAGGLPGVRRTT